MARADVVLLGCADISRDAYALRMHDSRMGHLALKQAFVDFSGGTIGRDAILVAHHPSGAPYVKGSDVYGSLAHTKGVGIGAVSVGPIGVDVEYAKDRVYAQQLLAYTATKHEVDEVASRMALPLQDLVAYIWTVKESVRKLLADARPYHPKEFFIRMEDPGVCTVTMCTHRALWRVRSFQKERFWFSVAQEYAPDIVCPSAVWRIADGRKIRNNARR